MRELISDVHSVSLLVYTSVAGLKFGLSLTDGTSRSLTKLCTIPAANTWTLITLPNLPVWASGGAWSLTPGSAGYTLCITLACGTTYMSPANDTWQNGAFFGAAGQDNFASKPVNSIFYAGFVQHEPGAVCSTPIDCPFTDNLDACLRYYQKTFAYATVPGAANAVGFLALYPWTTSGSPYGVIQFRKIMAKPPSVIGYSSITGAINTVRDSAATADRAITTVSNPSDSGFNGLFLSAYNAAATIYQFHYTADTGW
jgi:hypothetical protein